MNNLNTNEYPWHSASWDKFVTTRSQDHLPHALLLVGADGTGKLDFAKKIATSLLCTAPVDNKACQNCQSCKTYHANANPDFMQIGLLEDKQQITVDQIRQLSEFINYTRSFQGYRVILINPIERMNQNAANSLLKSLEEPADNTVIILVATNLGKILPTIKSRCQLLTLATPDKNQAISWLKSQSPELTQAEELLYMANGQPLTALAISDEDIQNKEEFAKQLLASCLKQKPITEVAKNWEKFDHQTLLNWQIRWLQTLIKARATSAEKNETNQGYSSEILSKLDKVISSQKQWDLYQQLISQKQYIHTSVNALIFVENMLLLWLQASSTTE